MANCTGKRCTLGQCCMLCEWLGEYCSISSDCFDLRPLTSWYWWSGNSSLAALSYICITVLFAQVALTPWKRVLSTVEVSGLSWSTFMEILGCCYSSPFLLHHVSSNLCFHTSIGHQFEEQAGILTYSASTISNTEHASRELSPHKAPWEEQAEW